MKPFTSVDTIHGHYTHAGEHPLLLRLDQAPRNGLMCPVIVHDGIDGAILQRPSMRSLINGFGQMIILALVSPHEGYRLCSRRLQSLDRFQQSVWNMGFMTCSFREESQDAGHRR